ncbi:MAG: hypothetical protein QOG53_3533 [Frankiales bacterium]|nr:hypothetical protein [Frankiales bacterium]
MRDVAAKYDQPKTSVLNILHAEGVARPRERIAEHQIQQASRLIQRGHTINKAAAKLGVSTAPLATSSSSAVCRPAPLSVALDEVVAVEGSMTRIVLTARFRSSAR